MSEGHLGYTGWPWEKLSKDRDIHFDIGPGTIYFHQPKDKPALFWRLVETVRRLVEGRKYRHAFSEQKAVLRLRGMLQAFRVQSASNVRLATPQRFHVFTEKNILDGFALNLYLEQLAKHNTKYTPEQMKVLVEERKGELKQEMDLVVGKRARDYCQYEAIFPVIVKKGNSKEEPSWALYESLYSMQTSKISYFELADMLKQWHKKRDPNFDDFRRWGA